jgi:selenocysteine lyase/cysteine desulfurase
VNVDEVRKQISLLKNTVYLDNAGAGPPPASVHAAMQYFLDEWRDYGERWESWLLDIVKSRELLAQLIGASLDEVACIPNVSSGLAAIASALSLGSGRNVVVSELNFPTNVYIWHALKQRGLLSEVKVLKAKDGKVPLEDYERMIDDDTLAVSLDYVSWITGGRENIPAITEIAHRHGTLMLVDAFHALGVMPIDVRGLDVDVLVSGTYKWLMGPHGAAYLYVKQELLDEFEPSIIGWHGISDSVIARVRGGQDVFGQPFDLSKAEPARDATRFEWGTWSMISVEGARAALEFTLKYPPEERWPLIEKLNERLVDGLRRKGREVVSPLEKERRSGIVNFKLEGATSVTRKLLEEHVVVAPRANMLRVSPHFYNTPDEIDTLLGKV